MPQGAPARAVIIPRPVTPSLHTEMLAKLEQSSALLTVPDARRASHLLVILPPVKERSALGSIPFAEALDAALKRRRKKLEDLAKGPIAGDLPHGALAAWVVLDPGQAPFEQQTAVRKALQALLAEKPREIAIAVYGNAEARRRAAEHAVYAAWVNGTPLPERKKKSEAVPLDLIRLHGFRDADAFRALRARASGNALCRELTVLPPNELTPGTYRRRVARLARERGWAREEYDLARLRRMGGE